MAKARKSVKKAPAKAKKTSQKKTAKAAPKRSAKTKTTAKAKVKAAKKAKAAPKGKAKTAPKPAKKPTAAVKAPKAPKPVALPNVGDPAPAFSLPTDGGGSLDLASFVGKKNVVLYFYPKDDTPGCTVQACTFEKDNTDYASTDTVVVGVSADSADSHARFRRKYSLNFPLVVDEGAKLANRYGVWVEKNNYGKKYMGIQRTTFLIGKDGKIANVWPRVTVDGHSAEVLSALRGL
jgi:peroxiredoxin Q/BCP